LEWLTFRALPPGMIEKAEFFAFTNLKKDGIAKTISFKCREVPRHERSY